MSSAFGLLEMETGVTLRTSQTLTDSGNNQKFTSALRHWSQSNDVETVVVMDGVVSGATVIPAVAGGNDNVDVLAGTYYRGSTTRRTLAADTNVAITRPATDVAKICSITISTGDVVAVVAGTDSADSSFSDTRGAAGGPPLLDPGAVELAQVKLTTAAAAPITASQIVEVVGNTRDKYDYPKPNIDWGDGFVTLASAIALSRTGTTTRGVYADFADATFSEIVSSDDFTPGDSSVSTSSTQVYGPTGADTVTSESVTQSQGSFTVYTEDGVTDPIIARGVNPAWVRFYPNRNYDKHVAQCGILVTSRSFPAGDNRQISVTLSPRTKAYNRES